MLRVTIVVVFSGAEVLGIPISELLQPAPVLAEEGHSAVALPLVQVVQAVALPAAAAAGGPPSGVR